MGDPGPWSSTSPPRWCNYICFPQVTTWCNYTSMFHGEVNCRSANACELSELRELQRKDMSPWQKVLSFALDAQSSRSCPKNVEESNSESEDQNPEFDCLKPRVLAIGLEHVWQIKQFQKTPRPHSVLTTNEQHCFPADVHLNIDFYAYAIFTDKIAYIYFSGRSLYLHFVPVLMPKITGILECNVFVVPCFYLP